METTATGPCRSAGVDKLCGWCLFAALLISLLHGFGLRIPVPVSGYLTLFAATLLFSRLRFAQRLQIALLSVAGFALILSSDANGARIIHHALTVNYAAIALLISVGFLRLIVPDQAAEARLSSGDNALWKTLLGVFLFAAVINFSAVVIFGDRLAKNRKLDTTQLMVLSRMFGANAMYSPFFVSMGAALIHSGGARFPVLLTAGLFMAVCAIIATGVNCLFVLRRNAADFKGYPMRLESLFIPLLLTLSALAGYVVFRDVSILILVSAVIVLTVLALLFLRRPGQCIPEYKRHIETHIPNSAAEVILFLSAGILAAGVGAFSQAADFRPPLEVFNGYHAAATLIAMVVASVLGMHPIISISVIGGLLAPLAPNPDLLGIMFIFSWGLSIPLSPLSALGLLIQSRYEISAWDLFRANLSYTLIMLIPACAVLILYGNSG